MSDYDVEADRDAELFDVAASHSRWLRHNGYVQPADCMDRLCELLVLVTGRLAGEPTAAPTRPTREQVRQAIAEADGPAGDIANLLGDSGVDWATDAVMKLIRETTMPDVTSEQARTEAQALLAQMDVALAHVMLPTSLREARERLRAALLAGGGTPDRCEHCGGTRDEGIGALVHREHCEHVAALVAARVGKGTAQPGPAEPTATQLYDAVKAKRYQRDAENPILTIPEIHAVLTARTEWLADRASGEGTAPQPDHSARDHHAAALLERVEAWVARVEGTPDPWRLVGDMADFIRTLDRYERGTAPQVPAEVLCVRCHVSRRADNSPLCPACKRPDYPDVLAEGVLDDAIHRGNVDPYVVLHVRVPEAEFAHRLDARVRVVAADGAPQEASDG